MRQRHDRPTSSVRWLVVCLALVLPGWGAPATGPAPSDEEGTLEAEVSSRKSLIQAGQPVWLDFLIRNPSDAPVTLTVADLPTAQERPDGMGLPIEHVFSGETGASIDVHVEADAKPLRVTAPPLPTAGHAVVVAPHSTVGTQIEMSRCCEALKRAGTYEIQWRPYHGTLQSNKLRLVIAPLRQAVIHTDFGRMTIRFDYDRAPSHVENFIDLAAKGFYDGLTFHRVVHGGLIQGGCPRGDGTGLRPDGKLLKAEISDLPIDVGTVCMATARNDPDSGSCQFYICLTRLRGLEGKQTVFGRLIGEESFETLRKLGSVPTGDQDRPIKPVYIRNISLDNVPLDEATRIGGTQASRPAGSTGSGKRGPAPLPGIGPSSGSNRGPGATTRPTAVPVPVGREATAAKTGSR